MGRGVDQQALEEHELGGDDAAESSTE